MTGDADLAPVTLAEVLTVLDRLYDPRWAQEWDAVGLVTGDPAQQVRRVLLAVDPVPAVIEEAAAWGADLLLTHHPLLLRAVHSVALTHQKDRLSPRCSGPASPCTSRTRTPTSHRPGSPTHSRRRSA